VYEGQQIIFSGTLMTFDDPPKPVPNVKIYIKQHDLFNQQIVVEMKTDEKGRFLETWSAENNNPFDSHIQVSASYEDAEGNLRYQKNQSQINEILIK